MQVFVPYADAFLCAQSLDPRRINKQIIECRQILKAIRGESSAWVNHPCVNMYRNHAQWLEYYMFTLECWKSSNEHTPQDIDEQKEELAQMIGWSIKAVPITPAFLTNEFCEQHRRRLYTKDPIFYKAWEYLGTSHENWYVVDNHLLVYSNGKLINSIPNP